MTVLPTGKVIRAVVFDKDGTLIDFSIRYVAVGRARLEGVLSEVDGIDGRALRRELLRTWGLDLDGERIALEGPLAHAPLEDDVAITAGVLYRHGLDWYAAKEIAQAAIHDAADRFDTSAATEPLPGVLETLRTLHAEGFRLGLVTNDTQAEAKAAVRTLGVGDLFGVALGTGPGMPSKPAPDMALQACRRLDVPPEETVVVGDSSADVQMARAAGVGLIVGVPTGPTPREELEAAADLLVARLSDLPPILISPK